MHEAAGICPAMVENKVAISVMQRPVAFSNGPITKIKLIITWNLLLQKLIHQLAGNQEHFTLEYFITQ